MKHITALLLLFFACAFPHSVSAFGMLVEKDHTVSGPGGLYGFKQTIRHSSSLPDNEVHTTVYIGPVKFGMSSKGSRLPEEIIIGLGVLIIVGLGAFFYHRISHERRA